MFDYLWNVVLMRKIFTYFFIVLFLIGAIGVNINTHYCKGRLAKVSIWADSEPCCKKDKRESKLKNNCCSDEVITLGFEDNFQKNHFSFEKLDVEAYTQEFIKYNLHQKDKELSVGADRAPPENHQKLYILYASLKLCA